MVDTEDWRACLPELVFAYNLRLSSVTQLLPLFLMRGFDSLVETVSRDEILSRTQTENCFSEISTPEGD